MGARQVHLCLSESCRRTCRRLHRFGSDRTSKHAVPFRPNSIEILYVVEELQEEWYDRLYCVGASVSVVPELVTMAGSIALNTRDTIIEIRVRQPDALPPPTSTTTSTTPRIEEVEEESIEPHQVPGEWPDVPVPVARPREGLERNASRRSRTRRLSQRLSVSSDIFHDAIEAQGYGAAGAGSKRLSGIYRHSIIEDSVEALGLTEPTEQLKVEEQEEPPTKTKYGPRIWAIMVALCVTNLLVALEGTVISTALPTIVEDLGGGEAYVWASTGYFLTK